MTLKKWFFSKQVYLFDLDGTLVLGKKAIPGAKTLLLELQKRGKKIFYFSNNSSKSELDYVRKLKSLAFPVSRSQILLSTHSLIRYLEHKKWKRIYLVGTPAMKRMIESQSSIRIDSKRPDGVVVGFDRSLNFEKLVMATRLITKSVPWVVTHPDRFCPTEEGPEPDCGAIAALLAEATQTRPIAVLGKPSPWMLRELQSRLRFRTGDAVLVGDRLTTDIQMAKNSGMESLFVLSGDHQRRDIKRFKLLPTRVTSSVRDLID